MNQETYLIFYILKPLILEGECVGLYAYKGALINDRF